MRNYSTELLSNFSIEELDSFTENQLTVLDVEDLKWVLKMRESERIEDERIARFWKEEYPLKSKEEKTKYWAGGLFQSMRMQEENNQNPYSIYSENWLRDALKTDPNFLELLPFIYNIWGGMFDAGKVDRIVQRLLKKI